MGPWQPDQVPDLVVGNLAYSRGLELDNLGGSFQPNLFYDCVILWFTAKTLVTCIW